MLCTLPAQEGDEDADCELAYVIDDVPAGSSVEGLEIECLDASGRHVPSGTSGKLRATWIRGTKKLQFDDSGRFELPLLKVSCHTLLVLRKTSIALECPVWCTAPDKLYQASCLGASGSSGMTLQSVVPSVPAVIFIPLNDNVFMLPP